MIKLLLVEDNPDDVLLVEEQLVNSEEKMDIIVAQQLHEAMEYLNQQSFDVILLDLSLPDATGLETVKQVLGKAPSVPIIVFTALDDQALALHIVQSGAQDYLVKGKENGFFIRHSIRYAIERKRSEQALQESEQRFRQLAEHINAVFWIRNETGEQLLYVSPAYERIWERTCESLHEHPMDWSTAIHVEDRGRVREAFFQNLSQGNYNEEYRIEHSDGTTRWIRDRGFPVTDDDGEVYRVVGIAEDITERKRMEEALWAIQSVLEGNLSVSHPITQGIISWVKKTSGFQSGLDTFGLSSQQQRVLAFVAEGKTNKEIALEMGLSDKTIRNHLAAVFEKLQISRRTQAAAFFTKYKGS